MRYIDVIHEFNEFRTEAARHVNELPKEFAEMLKGLAEYHRRPVIKDGGEVEVNYSHLVKVIRSMQNDERDWVCWGLLPWAKKIALNSIQALKDNGDGDRVAQFDKWYGVIEL